ncbi:MAG: alpha/beta hydrolase [Cyclobacteriaceae bacterium]|nr:alpha/beta hydrolase [Cyclobacteriaceae bacterium]
MVKDQYDIVSDSGNSLYAIGASGGDPSAVICFLHDIGGTSADALELANGLMAENIACFLVDYHGAGKSEGAEKHSNPLRDYVDDLEALCMLARKEYNDSPVFLLTRGFSDLVATYYLYKKKSQEISGIISMEPIPESILKNLRISFLNKILGFLFQRLPLITFNDKRIPYKLYRGMIKAHQEIMKSGFSASIPVLTFQSTCEEEHGQLYFTNTQCMQLPDCKNNGAGLYSFSKTLISWIEKNIRKT